MSIEPLLLASYSKPELVKLIRELEKENVRLTDLLNELTACCEYMNVINGRCVSCEAIR